MFHFTPYRNAEYMPDRLIATRGACLSFIKMWGNQVNYCT